MKYLYNVLKILQWSFLGTFAGSSLYRFLDFRANPGLYAMTSTPWYYGIIVEGIFTALVVGVLWLLTRLVKKKMQKK